MRCHWTTYKGQRVFMPGCEPGWYNEANCTCQPYRQRKEPTTDQLLIAELEKENARLNRLVFKKHQPALAMTPARHRKRLCALIRLLMVQAGSMAVHNRSNHDLLTSDEDHIWLPRKRAEEILLLLADT